MKSPSFFLTLTGRGNWLIASGVADMANLLQTLLKYLVYNIEGNGYGSRSKQSWFYLTKQGPL
jgi:hypothetical protein